MDALTDIPPTITAGDSLTWRKTLEDFPASSGWALSYILLNAAGKIEISAGADGSDHLVELSASATSAYPPGRYGYTAFVTLSGDRFSVASGGVEVLPDLAQLANYDPRTFAERSLDAIEAVLSGKASKDQLTYSLNGMSLGRYSWAELIKARDYFRAEVVKERRQVAGKKSNKVLVRFN